MLQCYFSLVQLVHLTGVALKKKKKKNQNLQCCFSVNVCSSVAPAVRLSLHCRKVKTVNMCQINAPVFALDQGIRVGLVLVPKHINMGVRCFSHGKQKNVNWIETPTDSKSPSLVITWLLHCYNLITILKVLDRVTFCFYKLTFIIYIDTIVVYWLNIRLDIIGLCCFHHGLFNLENPGFCWFWLLVRQQSIDDIFFSLPDRVVSISAIKFPRGSDVLRKRRPSWAFTVHITNRKLKCCVLGIPDGSRLRVKRRRISQACVYKGLPITVRKLKTNTRIQKHVLYLLTS